MIIFIIILSPFHFIYFFQKFSPPLISQALSADERLSFEAMESCISALLFHVQNVKVQRAGCYVVGVLMPSSAPVEMKRFRGIVVSFVCVGLLVF